MAMPQLTSDPLKESQNLFNIQKLCTVPLE